MHNDYNMKLILMKIKNANNYISLILLYVDKNFKYFGYEKKIIKLYLKSKVYNYSKIGFKWNITNNT